MSAERWPIDYEAISKGDVIPVGRVEEIVEAKQGTPEFDFGLMNLTHCIGKELHVRGKPWTLRTEKGAIKVLTDAEASAYNHAQQVSERRKMYRRFRLLASVDHTMLDEDQRKQHERYLEIDGKYLQAQNGVRSQLTLAANVRNVPGLPKPSPAPHPLTAQVEETTNDNLSKP